MMGYYPYFMPFNDAKAPSPAAQARDEIDQTFSGMGIDWRWVSGR